MHPIKFDLQLMRRDNDVRLTNRENEILQLLAKAMNRNEIAANLFISDETVKMHTKNLYKKLKAKIKLML